MTCAHCVQKVKKAILSIPEVTEAEISLPDIAIIHMSEHVSLEVLQGAIGTTGHYSIAEESPAT